MSWDLKPYYLHHTHGGGDLSIVSIGLYELCLSLHVAKDWRPKEINPFVLPVLYYYYYYWYHGYTTYRPAEIIEWKKNKSEKVDKYFDLTRGLKKLLNMKVTVILIVVGALWMIPKGLEKSLEEVEIRARIETIPTTALLKSARILRKVMENWGDLLSLTPEKNHQFWKKKKNENNY